MSASVYSAWNAATGSQTTGVLAPIAIATATPKTLLQLTTPSNKKIRVIEWGYRFTTTPSVAIEMELIDTGAIAGTGMTAVTPLVYSPAEAGASLVTAGFGPTAEGTITADRLLDMTVDYGPYYVKQFPLGREPDMGLSKVLRIRGSNISGTASTNVLCYIVWEE